MTNSSPRLRVAFIGLGNMGGPMARNIANAGFELCVADLDDSKVAAVVACGATARRSLAETVAGADLVMTSLPGPAQVRSVGEQIISHMSAGAVWVDLSTNDLDCAAEIRTSAAAHGIVVLDAPVTGGAEGAEAATLTVLCGGDTEAFGLARPVLGAIGDRVELLGPHGAGYVAKIASVSLCYLHSVSLLEALMLGAKGGVDPAKMLEVIQHSTGRSYVANRYGPELLNGGYDATFDLGLAAKDLRLALEMAERTTATLPFMASVEAFYREAEEQYGFSAPHLQAVQQIEDENDCRLHETKETNHDRAL